MQRLFSSFADGSPGAGLLLLRLLAGGGLLFGVIASAWFGRDHLTVLLVIAAGAGILLLMGLYTPMAGVASAITEAWVALSHPQNLWPPIVLIVLGLSLALIGPGAFSMDARLYGRKQIDPSNFERDSTSARK